MSLWMFMVLMLAIKVPLAALMLWMPFRNDEAMRAADLPGSSDEDGGSRTLPAGPLDPRPRSPISGRPFPRSPRGGPHGSPAPLSPPRARTPARGTRRVKTSR